MRRIVRQPFGHDGARRNPARRPTHNLDDTARAVVGRHAPHVEADLHHGRRIIFDDRPIAGTTVRVRQVVVDGLGHADDTHIPIPPEGFEMNFVRGVLRIVAANVEEVADIVRLENLEEAVHVARGVLGLLFEIDFIAAGAQGGGGCVFQAFDRFGLLIVDINQLFIEHAQDAVGATVDFFDTLVVPRFLNHASQARVNHGRGSTRLRHQQISNQFTHTSSVLVAGRTGPAVSFARMPLNALKRSQTLPTANATVKEELASRPGSSPGLHSHSLILS
jgi:hypothetical protein